MGLLQLALVAGFLAALVHEFRVVAVPTIILHTYPNSAVLYVPTIILHAYPNSAVLYVPTIILHAYPNSPVLYVPTIILHAYPSSAVLYVPTIILHAYPNSFAHPLSSTLSLLDGVGLASICCRISCSLLFIHSDLSLLGGAVLQLG